MLRKLAISAVLVAVCATVVQADVVSVWMPTKDAGITKGSTEGWGSAGASSSVRAGKSRENFMLVKFPWADIQTFLTPYVGNPLYTISVKVSLMSNGNNNATTNIRPTVIPGNVDWLEGDGTNLFGPPNFTVPSVTSKFAQTNTDYGPGNPPVPIPTGVGAWPWGDFDGLRLQPELYNPVSINIPMGTPVGTRLSCPLAPAFYNDQIDGSASGPGFGTTGVWGMYFWDYGSAGNNGAAFTREAGFDNAPWITVTIVPEPASMALLVMGGVGLLLRKRR